MGRRPRRGIGPRTQVRTAEGAHGMIDARTLCAGCGRDLDEQEAFIREGVPYCCESCADNRRCERGCGADIHTEEPATVQPCQ